MPSTCIRSISALIRALRNLKPARPTCTRPIRMSARRPQATRRRSSFSAAVPTASARASNSTTAACTRPWPCAKTATRRSWSTATPRPSRPTTTRRDRLYFEPVTLEDVLEICRRRKAHGRDRAVRRPDTAQALPRARGRGRAHHRHEHRRHRLRRRPRALPAAHQEARSAPAAQPHLPHRRGGAQGRPRKSATRSWCARATCWAAARWTSFTTPRNCSGTCTRRSW